MRLSLGTIQVIVRREIVSHGCCEQCHWWRLSVDTPSGKLGHCHRMAPIANPSGVTFFPKMRGNQSCGQWTHRRGEGVR